AWGASSACAKSRAVSRIMRCSPVRKSSRALVSMGRGSLRSLLGFLDGFLGLPVEVRLQPLGLLEGLHLRAERAFLGAFERLLAFGRGVDLRRLGLAAAGEGG